MKSVFRTVAFALAVLFLCATCSSAVYASSASETQENQSVRYQIIQQNNCDLVIPGATANIRSNVVGIAGSTTKCEIELKLQRKVLFWWTTVETWNKTALSYQASLNVTHAVESGKTYRAVAEFTVWNGSNSESATVSSAAKEAP